jgi:hypothetical protein
LPMPAPGPPRPMPTRLAGDARAETVTFPGLSLDQVPALVRSSLARMHSNLAHPSQADFVRFLINAKASLRTLVGAKGLRCSVCERNVKPKQPRPTAMPTIGRFNSTVQGDIFYVHLVTAAEVGVYGNICCSTLLHKADVSVNDTGMFGGFASSLTSLC